MKYLILIMFMIAFNNNIFAEDVFKGTIKGIVIDKETQKPLSGVTIKLINTKLGVISNHNGEFAIQNIDIGRYQLSASIIGYDIFVKSDVTVVTKRITDLTIEMTMSYIDMKEVVVSAESSNSFVENKKISYTEISNQEIKNTAGVNDLFRRLQFQSGIGTAGEQSSSPIVRGGNPDENLTIIENIEISSPYHFSSLNSESAGSLSVIDPKLIDKVEISTGGFEAKYGDKLSSVISIDLKKPGKENLEGDLSLDFAGIGANISGPITDKISFLFAGRQGILEYLMKMMDEKFIPTTSDFHFKSIFEIDKDHRLSFYSMYAQDKIEGSHEDALNADKIIFSDINKKQFTMGFNWRWLTSTNSFLLTTPYFNYSKWEMTNGVESNKKYYGTKNYEKYFGIKSEYFIRVNNIHRITFGSELRFISPEYSSWAGFDTLSNGNIIAPYSTEFKADPAAKFSTYLMYSASPYSWININSGIRSDYFSFFDKAEINPRVSINLLAGNGFNFNIATGAYSQFPEFYRIFSSNENKNLKPQKAIHYIAGMQMPTFFDINFKLEGYFKDYSNIATSINDTSKVLQSTGSGSSYGFELSFSKKMKDNFNILLNYSYSISKRKDNSQAKDYYSNYDKTHTINLIMNYKLGDWWEFSITGSYATGMPYTPFDIKSLRQENGIWYINKAEKNSDRYPDFLRIDARIDHRFIFASWNLKAYIDFWNITNHNNIFEYNYYNNFKDKKGFNLFPFMPIFGISAEL
jgi:hypothetical protein